MALHSNHCKFLSWTALSLVKPHFNSQRTDVVSASSLAPSRNRRVVQKSDFMNQSHDRNQGRCRSSLPNGVYDHAKRQGRGKLGVHLILDHLVTEEPHSWF